jgi:teichuronic acid biosynthesis glycosyltransferase TuaG
MSFSVIITSHNCESFIKSSLESALNQSLKPLEVIVVDDASKDKTFSILQRLERSISLLRVYRNPVNRERCFSRNFGAKVARGDWVCFLDCDDIWENNYLNRVNELLKGGLFSAVYGNPSFFIDPEGRILKRKKKPKESFEELLFSGRVGYPSGSCFKREVFLRLGGYSEKYLLREDWEIFLRFYLSGESIGYTPLLPFGIREHRNRTSKGNEKFLETTLRVYEDYKKKIPDRYRSLLEYHLAVQCFRFRKRKCGLEFLKRLNFKVLRNPKRFWELFKRLLKV